MMLQSSSISYMGKFGVFLTTSYDNAHTKNSGFSLFSFQDFCCGFLFFWMWVYYFFVCLLSGLTGWLAGTFEKEVLLFYIVLSGTPGLELF